MEIKLYSDEDEAGMFELLRSEGEDWSCYHAEGAAEKYKRALQSSVTYVAYEDGVLCGYVRCRDDDGFCVFIYDLLVNKDFRGRGYGRLLMERVCADYPDEDVYVLSGVDGYYSKLGYSLEGSIFKVNK